MSAAIDGLQRALELTEQMFNAASRGQWDDVVELEQQRKPWLDCQYVSDKQDAQMLATLCEHNRLLVERAVSARDTVGAQLGKHKYNHRALSTYLLSSQ